MRRTMMSEIMITPQELDRLKDFIAPLYTASHLMMLRDETEAKLFLKDAEDLKRLLARIERRSR
jgi:hypothetical protein